MWIEPADLSVCFIPHLYHLGQVFATAHDEWPLSGMRQQASAAFVDGDRRLWAENENLEMVDRDDEIPF